MASWHHPLGMASPTPMPPAPPVRPPAPPVQPCPLSPAREAAGGCAQPSSPGTEAVDPEPSPGLPGEQMAAGTPRQHTPRTGGMPNAPDAHHQDGRPTLTAARPPAVPEAGSRTRPPSSPLVATGTSACSMAALRTRVGACSTAALHAWVGEPSTSFRQGEAARRRNPGRGQLAGHGSSLTRDKAPPAPQVWDAAWHRQHAGLRRAVNPWWPLWPRWSPHCWGSTCWLARKEQPPGPGSARQF